MKSNEVEAMSPSDKMDFALGFKCHMAIQTADTITVISENSLVLGDTLKTSCCVSFFMYEIVLGFVCLIFP